MNVFSKSINPLFTLILLASLVAFVGCDSLTSSTADTDRTSTLTGSASSDHDDYDGGPVRGAVWNTDRYGTVVDGTTIFDFRRDVYIKGGPPPNAPATAAGLNDGMYVFQVTDPSGKVLLSMDPARCRVVRVEGGQIVELIAPTDIPGLEFNGNGKSGDITDYWTDKKNESELCHTDSPFSETGHASERHNTEEKDGRPGAITVQLMPFLLTPNNGGVHKTWITPLQEYEAKGGDLNALPGDNEVKSRGGGKPQLVGYDPDPGFGPPGRNIKTDNFKVNEEAEITPPEITVIKFHDKYLTGDFDPEDDVEGLEITGWLVGWEDPLGLLGDNYTRFAFTADEGEYVFKEDVPEGVQHTVTLLDGASQDPLDPTTITVEGNHEESHTLIYGNVGLGSIEACKLYDPESEGPEGENLAAIEGWRMVLTQTHDASGDELGSEDEIGTQYTGEDGCTTFEDLLPGTYRVDEVLPNDDWVSTNGSSHDNIVIESSLTMDNGTPILAGNDESEAFTNYCFIEERETVGFGTKGYWHNKNGQAEIETDLENVMDYVNSVSPYDFGENLDAVSDFLVDDNSEYQQLEQQLLAFIFNAWFRVGNDGNDPIGDIWVDGDWRSISSIIQEALAVGGDHNDRSAMASFLDGLNNRSLADGGIDMKITVISEEACEFEYDDNNTTE